jgi:hypothetical protein
MEAMQRVKPIDAARQMGVNKSTISRWLARNPALLDADGLVSVADLIAHRAAVIDPRLQTKGAAPALVAAPAAPAASDIAPTINDHKLRYERARADDAELDLAERLELTLRRRDVEAAVSEAAATLQQTAAQLCRDEAERITRIEDTREMERALNDLVRRIMLSGTAKLSAAIEPAATDAAA